MKKFLLLGFVALILSGNAAFAAPLAAPGPLAGVLQMESAAAPLCEAQVPTLFPALNAKVVPICQGNACDKTIDCRPVGLPECSNCFCLGPAGDKSCSCF